MKRHDEVGKGKVAEDMGSNCFVKGLMHLMTKSLEGGLNTTDENKKLDVMSNHCTPPACFFMVNCDACCKKRWHGCGRLCALAMIKHDYAHGRRWL